MLRKERDAISIDDDSDTTASLCRDRDTNNVEDDSDTTVSFSQDQDVGLYDIGGSSGVEEVETSYVEEGINVVHGEEQQAAKVAVVGNVPGKVHEEAVEEQADRGEDLEQGTVEKQLESMPGEGTQPSSTFEKELESMQEGSPRRSTSNINNRFLRLIE